MISKEGEGMRLCHFLRLLDLLIFRAVSLPFYDGLPHLNLHRDGSSQEQFAWGELEDEYWVGIAWGNRDIFPNFDFLIFRKAWGL